MAEAGTTCKPQSTFSLKRNLVATWSWKSGRIWAYGRIANRVEKGGSQGLLVPVPLFEKETGIKMGMWSAIGETKKKNVTRQQP